MPYRSGKIDEVNKEGFVRGIGNQQDMFQFG
jgi:hypothetical protein